MINEFINLFGYLLFTKAGRFSQLLRGYSTDRQFNIFIGCKPHARISHTGRKPTAHWSASPASVAQPVELLPHNIRVQLGTGYFHMVVPTLACAVGAKVMDIVADDAFLAEVNRKAGLIRQKLEGLVAAHPDVFEAVRGSGLMLGLKCKATNTDVVNAGFEEGVLCVPAADNVVRLLPALNITDDDIADAADKLDAAASRLKGADA